MGSTQLRKQAFWKGNEAVAQMDFCFCSNTQKHIEHREEIKCKDLGCLDQTYTVNTQHCLIKHSHTHAQMVLVNAETWGLLHVVSPVCSGKQHASMFD